MGRRLRPLPARPAGPHAELIKGSGGGSDATSTPNRASPAAVLSTGMADVHTPQEHIAVADMVNTARLLQEIVADGG